MSWLHSLVTFFLSWCDQSTKWYGFFSGPAILIGLSANAYVSWRKHQCYNRWCPLIGLHERDGRHYCRIHHRKK